MEAVTSVAANRTDRRVFAAQGVLFAITLFASSWLMFLLEPMVAKMVLPVLGGTPMVWNTCVLFFQIMLLAGYAYAHGVTSWLGTRRHAGFYALLILVPALTLPFSLRDASAPSAGTNPALWLLVLLAGSIGLPFFILSTSASLLQKLFSDSDHPSAGDPYFLYAASNLGSLLALVMYPTLFEPWLRLGDQSRFWSIGYGVFATLVLACIGLTWHRARAPLATRSRDRDDLEASTPAQPLSITRRLYWAGLSFVPSSLMLSVTTYLSTDIASAPLLWVVPLALFLLTFVLVFGARGARWRTRASSWLPWLVVPLVLIMTSHVPMPIWLMVPLHLATFTLAALLFHGTLAGDRPAASQLTEFYLWIAIGGVAGGLFNTLAAPLLFDSVAEYPSILGIVCFLRAHRGQNTPRTPTPLKNLLAPLAMSGLLAAGLKYLGSGAVHGGSLIAAFGLPLLVYAIQFRQPLLFALVTAGMMASLLVPNGAGQVLRAERTFFGVYRVMPDATQKYRELISGTTLHGRQAIDVTREGEALTYYHRTGPFGQAFTQIPSVRDGRDIAVVGLGVGTLASYARPGQQWTFYEIDPAVEQIARSEFSYLGACGTQCRVALGDARISLSRGTPAVYSLIVLDAFSSDAIPIHLMTQEAFALYLTHLAPDGVMAVHVSNRHLTLSPVVASIARAHGLAALEQFDSVVEASAAGKTTSDWILLTRDRRNLGALVDDTRWFVPGGSTDASLWTDDFSNILSTLRFVRSR